MISETVGCGKTILLMSSMVCLFSIIAAAPKIISEPIPADHVEADKVLSRFVNNRLAYAPAAVVFRAIAPII